MKLDIMEIGLFFYGIIIIFAFVLIIVSIKGWNQTCTILIIITIVMEISHIGIPIYMYKKNISKITIYKIKGE